MPRTRKVGVAGRFGPRYGKRAKLKFIEGHPEKRHKCPSCLKQTMKRQSSGIWICSKCGLKVAGSAYKPR